MSRSYRKPYHYAAKSLGTGSSMVGKRITSKKIRAKVRDALRSNPPEEDLPAFEGPTRGRAGSRSPDRGWDFFGDGRRLALPRKVDGVIQDKSVKIFSRK